jgi:outer membrane murein-binding lipoprotein Lpp
MHWLLAQLESENSAREWFLWISMIMLIGALVVLVPVVAGVVRRWKQRQLNAIEEDRAERRAGKADQRVDAWAASAERYIDHDKLPAEDDLFERDGAQGDDEADPPVQESEPGSPEEDDRDPYGLFDDKPYRDAEDEDEYGEDDDDWDGDEDEEDDEDEKR